MLSRSSTMASREIFDMEFGATGLNVRGGGVTRAPGGSWGERVSHRAHGAYRGDGKSRAEAAKGAEEQGFSPRPLRTLRGNREVGEGRLGMLWA